ncbi:NADPH-dependent FMN reductase [Saccharothrix australiensis]|uniref:NAD(P)H-dependent FMN reductase n=1 Tax=Saccharothrix australiensis TaxID=2072 RepID=A0A495VU01_9PSEU|nr:NAD(P)H-dependent oxidoreductase [Saccharothrix australiensis]RKT52871.1 NAD(P)H-dependent FMN reductase [Saccharothrix australiensis]
MSEGENVIKLAIIIGSTRKGRFGPVVANWFTEQARQRADVAVDVLDLADLGLPDVLHGFGEEPADEVKAVSPRLAGADAFVVVTPEYNHSFPAPLKSAIDWHYTEWQAKPVGFVSYGGVAGGLRAVEQLRQVFAELHAVTVRDTVSFHGAWSRFDEEGRPVDAEGVNGAAKTMLDQLVWWGTALSEARAKRPYGA